MALLPFASAPYNQNNDTIHVLKAGDTMTGTLVAPFVHIQPATGDANLAVDAVAASTAAFVTLGTLNSSFVGFTAFDSNNGAGILRIGRNGGGLTAGFGLYAGGASAAFPLVLQLNNDQTTVFQGNHYPVSNNTLSSGTPSFYWSNLYATRTNFNSTAYMDGGTAGQLTTAGTFMQGAHSAFGNTTSVSAFDVIEVGENLTPNGTNDYSGMNINMRVTAPFAGNGVYALRFNSAAFHTSGTANQMLGIQGAAQNTSTGNVNNLFGGFFTTENDSTGTVGSSYALQTWNINSGAGTLTNMFGLYVKSPANSGTIVNQYGIYMEDQNVGTSNKYAIFTNAGLVHHGDSMDLASGKTLTIPAGSIITDTTTGLKIGTATTQKLGFFNATPVVQQGATTDLGIALSNLGLRAAGTAYPITTSGAVTFTGATNLNNGVSIPLTKKLSIATGTNASAGTGTLAAGTVTIATTVVTANSLIFLTDTAASLTNVGVLSVSSKSAGTSFTVTSANVLDTSTFNWFIIN